MEFKLTINENTAKSLLNAAYHRGQMLRADINAKKEAISLIEEELRGLDKLMQQLKEGEGGKVTLTQDLTPTVDGYSPTAKWVDKIIFVFKEKNKSLTTSEIVNRICEIEPTLVRKSVSNSVAATLSVKSRAGEYFGIENKTEGNETVFYLLEKKPHDAA